MEARIARLEAHMEHVLSSLHRVDRGQEELRVDLGGLKTAIAKLETKVEHLPSKGFIVTATIGALALVAAVSAFIQMILVPHAH